MLLGVLAPVTPTIAGLDIHVDGEDAMARVHGLATAQRLLMAGRAHNQKLVVEFVVDLKKIH